MKSSSSIHSLLFDLIFLIQIEMKKVVKNTDSSLSSIEILILRVLVEHGEMTQQQLAQNVYKDKAQITRLIQGLVKKQLILKEPNSQDKRSFIVAARNSVKTKMKGFIEYEGNLVQKMLEGASEKELKSMKNLLKLMKNNIK
ncbi:MAG: MarR family transcriptional regulator [Thiotrichaceae bacterium]|nr:MarR family transcriptional regulator [Thiotrichaceae bacterium]